MARLQISVLSCYPTVTVRGKVNVTVCAFFGFSQLGGLGSHAGGTDNYNFDIPCGSGGRLKCLPQGASDVITPLVANASSKSIFVMFSFSFFLSFFLSFFGVWWKRAGQWLWTCRSAVLSA